MTPAQRAVQIRAGGRVKRCHGIQYINEYNTAMHQWGVAMLMFVLWPEHFQRLVVYCLMHDVPEAWVGDIPAPTKRYGGIKARITKIEDLLCHAHGIPLESEMSSADAEMLKNCDQIELWMWCQEQLLLGNQFTNQFILELEQFWIEKPLLPAAAALVRDLRDPKSLLPQITGVIKKLTADIAEEDAK